MRAAWSTPTKRRWHAASAPSTSKAAWSTARCSSARWRCSPRPRGTPDMGVTVTPDQLDLAAWIRPGDGIVIAQGTGEPLSATEALVRQRAAYSGATIFFGTVFSRTFQPEHADHLRFSGFGGIGSLRALVKAGVLDPIPCHISSIAGLLRDRIIRSDVVMVMVSPANARGEHSLGLVNDYVRAAIDQARVVIAEVSSQVPWTPCDRPLHADEITVAVHSDRAPLK
ncbi:MAG: hypothetical protein EOO24_44565, partial [Comamonadaceae bacterium]